MSITIIAAWTCDRCESTCSVEYTKLLVEPPRPDGWERVLGCDACPDCVEAVREFLRPTSAGDQYEASEELRSTRLPSVESGADDLSRLEQRLKSEERQLVRSIAVRTGYVPALDGACVLYGYHDHTGTYRERVIEPDKRRHQGQEILLHALRTAVHHATQDHHPEEKDDT